MRFLTKKPSLADSNILVETKERTHNYGNLWLKDSKLEQMIGFWMRWMID